jgi:hypothetical protein
MIFEAIEARAGLNKVFRLHTSKDAFQFHNAVIHSNPLTRYITLVEAQNCPPGFCCFELFSDHAYRTQNRRLGAPPSKIEPSTTLEFAFFP